MEKIFENYISKNIEEFREIQSSYKVFLDNYIISTSSQKQTQILIKKDLKGYLIFPEKGHEILGIGEKSDLETKVEKTFLAHPEGFDVSIGDKNFKVLYKNEA